VVTNGLLEAEGDSEARFTSAAGMTACGARRPPDDSDGSVEQKVPHCHAGRTQPAPADVRHRPIATWDGAGRPARRQEKTGRARVGESDLGTVTFGPRMRELPLLRSTNEEATPKLYSYGGRRDPIPGSGSTAWREDERRACFAVEAMRMKATLGGYL
jgi:hypothetical protein